VKQVVLVTGLAGMQRPLQDETVHRFEIFSRLSDLDVGELIKPAALAKVLLHPEGGQKNIPTGARKVVLLNQADTPELQSAARGMTAALLQGFNSVIIASVDKHEVFAVHEPTAGIILAAGESRRFGQPKQLLDWKGQPFVRAVAKTALEAGLDPVLVVTGANRESVEATVQGLNISVVHNADWSTGQGSSIRKAVQVLNDDNSVGSAIFLLVDQPQVTQSILQALVERHAQGLYPVVAPIVTDRRANPVLFDRDTFPDLMILDGDVGGRAIFHKHRVEYLPWHDDRLLLDVDTPEQYQRLISDETL
jgi:molybdenum cofactor cytidylyltransferase